MSDKAMMLKLTTKALKLISGSPKQKQAIEELNEYRQKLGLKPINTQNLR